MEQSKNGCLECYLGCCCGCAVLACLDNPCNIYDVLTGRGACPPANLNPNGKTIMSFISNKTIKTLPRECRQLLAMLPSGMPEALEGRGFICRKMRANEAEMLASFLKAGEMRLARMMLRHLLCRCGAWQIAKCISQNLELRLRADQLLGIAFQPI